MCARYSLSKKEKDLMKEYSYKITTPFTPDNNIAPTDIGLVITADQPEELQAMHFGLVPYWAKDKKIGASMLNAREEEVMEKRTYAPLVEKHKTCLVLADGFYEWDKKSGSSIPYYFSLKDREIFAFAGLWSQWKNGDEVYRSFTILTTESNEIVGKVHAPKYRMPVILSKEEEKIWLDRELSPNELLKLCNKYPDDLMNVWQVSTDVNTPRAEGEHLNQPI